MHMTVLVTMKSFYGEFKNIYTITSDIAAEQYESTYLENVLTNALQIVQHV
jgi:hypothetical protein